MALRAVMARFKKVPANSWKSGCVAAEYPYKRVSGWRSNKVSLLNQQCKHKKAAGIGPVPFLPMLQCFNLKVSPNTTLPTPLPKCGSATVFGAGLSVEIQFFLDNPGYQPTVYWD
jgi:hypothetical protein